MKISEKQWLWLGPLCVVIGAGLWGTETYFRVNLNSKFDPEVLVFHEHLFCILFTLPAVFFARRSLRQITKTSLIYLLLSGVVGSAIGTTFFTLSLNALNPSVANVLLNFQPIVSVFFASLLLSEKLGKHFFLWGTIALVCGLVIASGQFDISQFHLSIGLIYISIAALAWGFSTVAGRGAMLSIPLIPAVFGRFVIGAVTLAISLMFKGKFFDPELMKWESLSDTYVIQNYVWLSFVSGVIPLFFYFKGLAKTSASVGGFCELTQTFTALLLTWGVMGNPLSPTQAIAGVALLFSVYMINVNFGKANHS